MKNANSAVLNEKYVYLTLHVCTFSFSKPNIFTNLKYTKICSFKKSCTLRGVLSVQTKLL